MPEAGRPPQRRGGRKQDEEIQFHFEGELVEDPSAERFRVTHPLKYFQIQIADGTARHFDGGMEYSTQWRIFFTESLE